MKNDSKFNHKEWDKKVNKLEKLAKKLKSNNLDEALDAAISIIEIIKDPAWNIEKSDTSGNEFIPSHARA